MRKNDTALYKIKVCAISVLLCGLFTVFAVGCSNQEGDDSESTSESQNSNVEFPSVSTVPKITLPTNGSAGVLTGNFSGGRPSETKATLDGNKVTIGEIALIPITRPDVPDETVSDTKDADNTKFDFELPKGTINTQDVFDIVDDTTATMVYGFND